MENLTTKILNNNAPASATDYPSKNVNMLESKKIFRVLNIPVWQYVKIPKGQ